MLFTKSTDDGWTMIENDPTVVHGSFDILLMPAKRFLLKNAFKYAWKNKMFLLNLSLRGFRRYLDWKLVFVIRLIGFLIYFQKCVLLYHSFFSKTYI